ncbi:MAG: hypothetical protein ABIR51_06100 [Sphingomicrobium sp.]
MMDNAEKTGHIELLPVARWSWALRRTILLSLTSPIPCADFDAWKQGSHDEDFPCLWLGVGNVDRHQSTVPVPRNRQQVPKTGHRVKRYSRFVERPNRVCGVWCGRSDAHAEWGRRLCPANDATHGGHASNVAFCGEQAM